MVDVGIEAFEKRLKAIFPSTYLKSMNYVKSCLFILLVVFNFFPVLSQKGQLQLTQEEPLDRLYEIVKFLNDNKDNEKNLEAAHEKILASGNTTYKIYFEYFIDRVKKFASGEVSVEDQLALYSKYLPIAQERKEYFLLTHLYENIAQVYRLDKQYVQALKYYLYAADEASKDKRGLYFRHSLLFYQIGLQYYEFKDYEKSLKFSLIANTAGYYNDPNPARNGCPKPIQI